MDYFVQLVFDCDSHSIFIHQSRYIYIRDHSCIWTWYYQWSHDSCWSSWSIIEKCWASCFTCTRTLPRRVGCLVSYVCHDGYTARFWLMPSVRSLQIKNNHKSHTKSPKMGSPLSQVDLQFGILYLSSISNRHLVGSWDSDFVGALDRGLTPMNNIHLSKYGVV